MIRPVKRADIVAFVRRDWASVAEAKARYWLERKRAMSVDDALAVVGVKAASARVLMRPPSTGR